MKEKTYTQQIIDFVLDQYNANCVYGEVETVLKAVFQDSVSCMIRGRDERCVQTLLDLYRKDNLHGGCSVVSHPDINLPPAYAAAANGTAIHSQDYDDNHIDYMIHQESVIISSSLAVAEKEGKTVEDFLKAVYIGMQVMSAIDEGVRPQHYWAGWHCTSTEGVFGATAAAGFLLHLTSDQLNNAFGIAASACGGHQKNFGTDSKPYQVGQAASAGVTSAYLALYGYTGCLNLFDTDFWDSYSPRVNRDMMIEALYGKAACIGLRIKNYPCGIPTHSGAINGMYFRNTYGIKAEDIKEIRFETPAVGARITKNTHPETGLKAKFSIPFTFACGLVFGKVDDRSFRDDLVTDPRILAVLDKVVEVAPNDELTPTTGGKAVLTLKNGETIENTVHMLAREVTPEFQKNQARNKFIRLCTDVLGEEHVEKILNCFDTLSLDAPIKYVIDAIQSTK